MHINNKILSLPPYISTSWNNVSSIRLIEGTLVISLQNDETIKIPDLSQEMIESIFVAHASHLEQEQSQPQLPSDKIAALFPPSLLSGEGDFGFRIGVSGMEGMGQAMQHNPDQSHTPDLPKEMLEKIASIAKIVAPEDLNQLPKAEPHCNCMHCQVSRAIREQIENLPEIIEEEEVSDEDLIFTEWHIEKSEEKIFTVINKLNPTEKYTVHLGTPVGCTCGSDGCEHILAVLRDDNA